MTDELWAAIVRGRRQDLLRAITQTALGRAPARSSHRSVRRPRRRGRPHRRRRPSRPSSTTLHDPPPAVPGSTRAAREDGRPAAHALSRLVARRPRRPLRRPLHRPLRPRPCPWSPRPVPHLRLRPAHRPRDDLRLRWMEAALPDPEAPSATSSTTKPGGPSRTVPPGPHASPMETVPRPRHLQPDDHPPPLRPRRRRRRQQPIPQPGPRTARDCSTKVIYAQEPDQIPDTVDALGLTTTEGHELLTLARGEALWRVGADRTFIVTHRITSHEHTLFDTNTRMLARSDPFPGI